MFWLCLCVVALTQAAVCFLWIPHILALFQTFLKFASLLIGFPLMRLDTEMTLLCLIVNFAMIVYLPYPWLCSTQTKLREGFRCYRCLFFFWVSYPTVIFISPLKFKEMHIWKISVCVYFVTSSYTFLLPTIINS